MKTLREVRLYHWQLVLKHRAAAKEERRVDLPHHKLTAMQKSKAQQHDGIADKHHAAVYALNDVVDSTAEEDQSMYEKSLKGSPR